MNAYRLLQSLRCLFGSHPLPFILLVEYPPYGYIERYPDAPIEMAYEACAECGRKAPGHFTYTDFVNNPKHCYWSAQ